MEPQWSVSVRPLVFAAATLAVLTIPAGAAPRNARLTGWDAAAVERARSGAAEKLCRSSRIALVATPNVRRVVVCPEFANLQLRQPREAEAMVIHEILHTLGLGENPPTSIEITRRVEFRCH
jgi:hypothetical protein